jgi:hypothetical protein
LSFKNRVSGRMLAGALAGSVILAGATAALAAHPADGKTYRGSVTDNRTERVSFSVTSNGQKVVKLIVPVPLGCQGGGIDTPPNAQTANVTSQGTFKKRIPLTLPGKPSGSGGSETVTGRFQAGGKERGTITDHLKGFPPSCSTSVHYSTHD